jgi:hypothetical protein
MKTFTTEEKSQIVKGIRQYGGSFMKYIGEAPAVADSRNEEKIYDAWPAEMEQYLEMGKVLDS